jgi:hypothetical protein
MCDRDFRKEHHSGKSNAFESMTKSAGSYPFLGCSKSFPVHDSAAANFPVCLPELGFAALNRWRSPTAIVRMNISERSSIFALAASLSPREMIALVISPTPTDPPSSIFPCRAEPNSASSRFPASVRLPTPAGLCHFLQFSLREKPVDGEALHDHRESHHTVRYDEKKIPIFAGIEGQCQCQGQSSSKAAP